jgi:hypothetical protein
MRWLTCAVVFAGMLMAAFSGLARAAAPENHAWPGRNGDLVLEAYAPGNSNTPSILMVHPNGTGLRTVFGDGLQTRYAWDLAPDGAEILGGGSYACARDALDAVSLLTGASGPFSDIPPQDRGTFPCSTQDRDAAYSYDGSKIAFARAGPSVTAGVWVAQRDGSNLHRVAAARDAADLRWAADTNTVSWVSGGSRYMISSDLPGTPAFAGPGRFAPQPGRPSNWVTGTSDSPAVLSPDGTKIAYLHCCFLDTAEVAQPMIANADGSGAQRVVPIGLAGDCSLAGCGDASRGTVYQLLWQTVPASAPDMVAPTVTITQPAEGQTFNLGSIVAGVYTCQDDDSGSGIRSCVGPVPDHNALDTSTLGHHTFTVQAVDNAGNVTTLTRHYEVIPAGVALYRADLAVIRAELTSMRSGFPSFWSRFWLDKAVESTDWAADAECWTADGQLATTDAGYRCLRALRIVVLRLNYADRSLRMASGPQRDELVDLIAGISWGRLEPFTNLQDVMTWRASGPTAPLWSARRDVMDAGYNPNRIQATIGYIRAWHRLMNLTPQP